MIQILIKEDRIMKRFFFISAMAALALTACQKEQSIDENKTDTPVIFSATTESPATKTALSKNGEQYDVLWQEGDQITIVDAASNVGVYHTSSTTAKGSFSFVSGTVATTPDYKAWYPASIYNAGTPTLPAKQEYAEGNIKNSPMYAESNTESLSFKNICGIIRLKISTTMSGKKVRSIALSATQPMSGAISNAATLANDSHIAVISEGAGITLDCGKSGVAIGTEPTAFHFAVPANSYTGLKITVLTTDGDFQTRTLKNEQSIVVGRSSITEVTIPFNKLNLVQRWPFDGNANNSVSGGIDAKIHDAHLTTDRFGNENSAYYFDGYWDRMQADDAANFGKESFTANVWVNSTQTSGIGNILRTHTGNGHGWLFRFKDGKIEIWECCTAAKGVTSDNSYADGKWHMMTYVRDVEKMVGQLYVDGIYVCEYKMTGIHDPLTTTLWFGTYETGEWYNGKMDDVRLYNRALTAEEIAAIYVL